MINPDKLRPLGDRLLVQVFEAEEKFGSIIIPEQYRERPLEVEVLAVGRDVVDVVAGDVVWLPKYCGDEVDDGMVIVREELVEAKREAR